jgi:hypothetical protein
MAGTTRLQVVGLLVNLATIALWTWSRTLGLPVGAEPGTSDSVGYPDVIATAFELGLVVVVVLMLLDARDGPRLKRLRVSELDAFVASGLAIRAVAILHRRCDRRRAVPLIAGKTDVTADRLGHGLVAVY